MADWSKYATGKSVVNDPADDLPAIDPSAPAAAAPKTDWSQYEVKPAAAAAPAAPADPANPPRTMMGRILDAIHPIVSGMNSGAADLAGLPMDAANSATNTVRHALGGVSQLVTGQPSSLMQDPDAASVPGTSANLKALAEKHFPGTMNDPDHPIQHFIGELAGPGGGAALADRAASTLSHAPDMLSAVGAPSDATPLATARGAGFPTTASNIALRNPTMQPSILEQARELVQGGNGTLTASNNAQSTARATELAGQQMGLGDGVTKITVPDLKTAKVAPGAAYDLTGQALGNFKPTSNMQNLLKDAAADTSVDSTSAARTAANRILGQIDPETGQYAGGGAALVKDISSLRESSNTRGVANILDDEMDRQAQNSLSPTLTKNYRDARRQFAQIYTVQDALAGGQVDPQAIGAVHQANPNLLTGNLRLIGNAATELPADVKLPTSADSTLESMLGGVKSLLGAPARAILSRPGSQDRFGPTADAGGESYFPTYGQKPEAAAAPLKLALAPGNAGRIMPSEGGPHGAQIEAAVPQNPRPLMDLQKPEGQVGELTPVQGGLSVPQGPESISGAPPSSAGANSLIRPLGDAFQPHQPDLFPPDNVSPNRRTTVKAPVKPKGISDDDWKLLNSLGLGE